MKFNYFYTKLFFILGMIFVLLVSLLIGVKGYDVVKEKKIEELEKISVEKTNLVENFLEVQEKKFYSYYDENLFRTFLKMNVSDKDYQNLKNDLHEKFNVSDGTVMGIINSSGSFLVDTEGILEGFNIREYPEGVDYLEKGSEFIDYWVLPHPFYDSFYLLTPKKIYGVDGSFIGIFSYRIPDADIQNFLKDLGEFNGFAESYLVNDNYRLLTPSMFVGENNSEILVQIVNTSNSEKCIHNLDLYEGNFSVERVEFSEYQSYTGEYVLGTYSLMNKPDWCLIVEISKTNFNRKIYFGLFFRFFVLFIFLVSIFLFCGYFIDRKFSRKR